MIMLILYAHFPWFKMDKRGANNQKTDKGIIVVWFLNIGVRYVH